jgi:hypothetical protein
VLNTTTEADDTHPGLRAKAAEALHSWRDRLKKIIDDGMAAGEFGPHTDPVQAALTIIALLEGMIMIARATGSASHARAVLASLEDYIKRL